MKKITSEVLREKYLKFFESKGHSIIDSASLIPENDPSVLFTTAGMHPLVPFLLGEKHPMGDKLCNFQACIRTNDIDEVGDSGHCTFFEMLGNWTLGECDKTEMIKNSFEFLTQSMGKVFNRVFKAPLISSYIYLMSLLCGYPMGANLVGIFINKGLITQNQGNKILSFSSQSGPVFIVGTVGICFFKSAKIGLIILFLHLLSSIICGLIFRNCMIKEKKAID